MLEHLLTGALQLVILLWNNLPLSLRGIKSQTTFKRDPQTHLFNLYFGA